MPPNIESDELAPPQTLPTSILYDTDYVDPFNQSNSISCPLVSVGKREKKKSTLWTICPFILGNEFCERLAYYGLATNLVVYLQLRCGFSASEAATQTSNWSGTCYVTPLIGAWLADSYFGRFKTIAIFTFIYLVGMVTLTIHPAFLETKDHESPEPLHQFAFFLALYIVALGTGGIKPNVSAFGADQFDEQDPQDADEKKSFFNWFYFAINLGSLLASLVVVYIQENISWTIGFAIPAVALAVASFMFWAGRHKYKFSEPKESPLERLMKIMWTASISPRSQELEGAFEEGSWVDRWLDRAVQCGKYTVAQVLEVKLVVRLMPVFFTQIMYWAVYTQMSTVFVEQGEQMNRKVVGSFSIPAASLSTFDTVSIIVLVPIFDGFVYPVLEGSGYRLTPLRKIGWGMLFAVFSMLCAAAVEYRRLQMYHEGHTLDSDSSHKTSVDMTVFWQTGQYLLVGASEVMASIAQLEFFYEEAPVAMRSCAMALQLLSTALGSYLAGALLSIIGAITHNEWIKDDMNEGRLDLYFVVIAALMFANLLIFILVAQRYTYRDKGPAEYQHAPESPHMPDMSDLFRAGSRDGANAYGITPAKTREGEELFIETDAEELQSRSIAVYPDTPAFPAQLR